MIILLIWYMLLSVVLDVVLLFVWVVGYCLVCYDCDLLLVLVCCL